MTHHEELLAQAIVHIAELLGGEINVPLTGPEVLVLAEETAERIGELSNLLMDMGADLLGAQAKVAAVEALADRMDARFDHDYADAIRAALAGASMQIQGPPA